MGKYDIKFGVWYDFRNPPQWRQDPTALYKASFDQIVRVEDMGFENVWLSEHHFIEDGYSPSMLPIGCAIAARTEKIRIGTSLLLLPLHHPVQVAEDAATLDVISGGRLELGLGVGYRVEEFAGMNVDPKERAQRMDEGVEIIQRLFAGERFSFNGLHYQYKDIEIFPKPVQKKVYLRMGGFSRSAVRRAARMDCGFLLLGPAAEWAQLYWSELDRLGKSREDHSVAGGYMWVHVSRDPKKRWKEVAPHWAYQQNLYTKWISGAGMANTYGIQEVEASQEALEANSCFILEPDEAIAKIKGYIDATGADHWYTWAVPPGMHPSWSEEHLELMATEVIPAFRAMKD